jgi:S1/P1 Nuclease
MKKSILVSLGAVILLVCSSLAYGPTGHEIVGGIADKLLANTPTATKVNALIDGITLEKASVIPDEIRAWDKNGVDGPTAFPYYSEHPKIDKQLRDFWRANQPTHDLNSAVPSHHWFHYTDVPVLNTAKYSDGKTGRSKWDIVHMICYCIAVLQGERLEDNPRKITKPVAVILLAHYVGDIHQPLHVGAEYFDEAGHAVDPDKGTAGLGDEGGNTFALHLKTGTPEEMTHRALKLHPFWDNEAVVANLPSLPLTMSKEERYEKTERAKRRLIDQFMREEPVNWRLPSNVVLKNYAEAWADEILPIAREAHERLRFTNVHAQHEENWVVATGVARERSAPDHVAYAAWAAKIVREELHKAGWRLADLLKEVLTPTITNARPAPIPPEPIPAEPNTQTETQPSHP